MNEAIRHRGPDDEGFALASANSIQFFSGPDSSAVIRNSLPLIDAASKTHFAIGFRRLSIQDLSENGHQPMFYKHFTITFNGEIYNFKALRSRLKASGHTFNSSSDTEVILHAFEEWGINMVKELVGMFAIVLHDERAKKTYFIRDRFGIKPFFYHRTETSLTWSSEIKGLLACEWIEPKIHLEGLLANYQFNTSPHPSTCFENIFSLPPAQIMVLEHEKFSIDFETYWQLPSAQKNYGGESAQEEIRQQLQDAIGEQLIADVPLITMMSGGIDSTLITALAHRQNPQLACYTLSIDGSGKGIDELPQAQAMAQKIGIRQLVQHLSDEELVYECLENLEHFEEPYNSLDVIFNASKFLKEQGFTVVLSGNGADEVFGGYGYNLKLAQWRERQRFSALSPLVYPLNRTLQKIKHHLDLSNVGRYFLSTTGGMRDYHLAQLLPQYSVKQIKKLTDPFLSLLQGQGDYEQLFELDLRHSVGSHHVYHDDICAMRYSLEMRYPYLDHRLVELVAKLPVDLRYNGRETKPLLRSVAKGVIHEENLKMPKKGFTLPLNRLIMTNQIMRTFVNEQLHYLKQIGIFNSRAIDQIVQEGFKDQFFLYVWQLVTTAVWHRKYIAQK